MQKIFIITGSLLGAAAVMIGAFGAHILRNMLEASGRTETFETAVKYQFYHAIALVVIGVLMFHVNHRWLSYSGYSFFFGVLIFSGSLYLLCFTGITKFAMITPLGGLLMIIGWLLLAGGTVKGM
jgi:uncharacterized membrane protein YgdD (TMEM256/DUF423 family)